MGVPLSVAACSHMPVSDRRVEVAQGGIRLVRVSLSERGAVSVPAIGEPLCLARLRLGKPRQCCKSSKRYGGNHPPNLKCFIEIFVEEGGGLTIPPKSNLHSDQGASFFL